MLEASTWKTLLSVFKQTLRKSKNKFWIIKKVCGLHNNSLLQQNADESEVINGNGCLLSGAGLQGLLECDASVSTAGLNAQLSATTAMLTAHKHPVIAAYEEARTNTHARTHTSLIFTASLLCLFLSSPNLLDQI